MMVTPIKEITMGKDFNYRNNPPATATEIPTGTKPLSDSELEDFEQVEGASTLSKPGTPAEK